MKNDIPKERMKVFLSHAEADESAARNLASGLSKAGFDVWYPEKARKAKLVHEAKPPVITQIRLLISFIQGSGIRRKARQCARFPSYPGMVQQGRYSRSETVAR